MDKRFDWLVPAILVLAIATTEMAVDMYIPSLPLLSHYFHAEEDIVALTLSGHLLALLSQEQFMVLFRTDWDAGLRSFWE